MKIKANKKRRDQDGDGRWLGEIQDNKKIIWEDLLDSVFKFDCFNKFSRILTYLKKQSTYYFKEGVLYLLSFYLSKYIYIQ